MKKSGNTTSWLARLILGRAWPGLAWLVLAWLALAVSAQAALLSELDRTNIAMGDSARLTISATEDEELSEIDLSELERDFEILRRSTSSNISIINGKRSQEKKLVIDVTPRREGYLVVPSFRTDGSVSRPLQVRVGPAPDQNTAGNPVLFTTEVDTDSAYVQSQVLLTLRIQQSIELESMSVSELEIDGAFVKPLETKEFYRSIDGRNWRVHEVRYAIFPEQSGELQIPTQVFSARAAEGRRSFFSRGSGRLIRRSTNPLTVTVKPRPPTYTEPTWLPAQQVKIEERWSTPPENLKAGESATRTITLIGEGVQGAQLPPVLYEPTDGLKFYPDQPEINEQEVSSGLLGSRRDSTAIVPTKSGEWSLPEIRVPWWDTATDQMRFATLPARTVNVSPAPAANTADPTSAIAGEQLSSPALLGQSRPSALWPSLFAVSTAGWLATLFYLWQMRRNNAPSSAVAAANASMKASRNASERSLFRSLRSACQANEGTRARDFLIRWSCAFHNETAIRTLDDVNARFGDATLAAALRELDGSLYRDGGQPWNGSALLAQVTRLRGESATDESPGDTELSLYQKG